MRLHQTNQLAYVSPPLQFEGMLPTALDESGIPYQVPPEFCSPETYHVQHEVQIARVWRELAAAEAASSAGVGQLLVSPLRPTGSIAEAYRGSAQREMDALAELLKEKTGAALQKTPFSCWVVTAIEARAKDFGRILEKLDDRLSARDMREGIGPIDRPIGDLYGVRVVVSDDTNPMDVVDWLTQCFRVPPQWVNGRKTLWTEANPDSHKDYIARRLEVCFLDERGIARLGEIQVHTQAELEINKATRDYYVLSRSGSLAVGAVQGSMMPEEC